MTSSILYQPTNPNVFSQCLLCTEGYAGVWKARGDVPSACSHGDYSRIQDTSHSYMEREAESYSSEVESVM